jgi:pimeloyl-ACP methyl ester carboxylesterase
MSDRNSELPLPVPTTYVFGKNKRATFHTQGFLDRLEKAPGYSWVAMECGHFIQAQKPDELEQIIRQRIAQ